MTVKSYRRPLNKTGLALDFVKHVMGEEDKRRANYIATRIMNEELVLGKLESKSSLNSNDYRDAAYYTEEDRETLREQIVSELIYLERVDDDEKIKLGIGGSCPKEVKRDKTAIIITGPPASGKSKVASALADQYGAYLLDSDYAKRKFPEYNDRNGGASYVHDESDTLIFGEGYGVFEFCVFEGANIVIPAVGKTENSLDQVIKKIKLVDYTIHLVNVCLDRYDCLIRAVNRFEDTGRYVPLSYIFDEVSNEPERIYFITKRKFKDRKDIVSTFAQLSNDVPKGKNPYIIEADKESPVWAVYQEKER